ncbi:chemotaxis response regulator protein-glutamate methylesterase [Longimicrobium sp.]|uniref:protein-glutamate methylesterase/protein-glutamine glutaminase n=1 Tax=Longimicrobium sp. TaxID=2029185 RepID=UPI002E2F6884|nr:chemotaxis response regulator protein-glutamate methylesterase [Longimicrobium sp.]HEX6042518.1 chemotaxis response regulator protein-glutamate methylesterase [Longimicrobium sp.]
MTPESPIRVMVVDDSTVIRGVLGRIVDAQPDMKVVASAPNGRSALDLLRHRGADVVLLDVEMPEMDGLAALPRILAEHPDVRVMMASSLTQKGAQVTLNALALGAADFIAKPSSRGALGLDAVAAELVTKIRGLMRRPLRTAPAARPAPPPGPVAPLAPVAPLSPLTPLGGPGLHRGEAARIVAIASSTGGPNALSTVLRAMPADFATPILITQHMPPAFTAALADRLARETGRPCREAVQGEPVLAGHTYVAPGEHHMTVMTREREPVIRLDQGPPENHCRPAADPMLRSVAAVYGPAALAVVLTGMGEDGRRGCGDIRRRGGRIVAQDEATSVVWGMPGAVVTAGLADAVLPLDRIAHHIQSLSTAAHA